MPEMMSTREVAEYLRVKERKVYDLVRRRQIPCTRVTGKLLFPKLLIDQWLAEATDVPDAARRLAKPAPPVVAGSHDPLLDWALRESHSDLALLAGGSLDGLKRLKAGEARISGLHVLDPESGEYNRKVVEASLPGMDVVVIEWAWREQGLVVAPGNPLGIAGLADLRAKRARIVQRQAAAGSQLLFRHLIEQAGIAPEELVLLDQPALSETDLGLAVQEGKADAGPAIRAAAQQFRLDFVALARERFDLVMRRRDYFEPPVQKLLGFARTDAFRAHAQEMGGYDTSGLGRVVYNGP